VLWSPHSEKPEASTTGWKGALVAGAPVLGPALLGAAAVALIDLDQGLDALETVVQSDRVAIAATGLTAAVFIGGSAVAWILTPFTVALAKSGETPTVPTPAGTSAGASPASRSRSARLQLPARHWASALSSR
jgi:hypothetical protein